MNTARSDEVITEPIDLMGQYGSEFVKQFDTVFMKALVEVGTALVSMRTGTDREELVDHTAEILRKKAVEAGRTEVVYVDQPGRARLPAVLFERLHKLEELLSDEEKPDPAAFKESQSLFDRFWSSSGATRQPALGLTERSTIQAYWKDAVGSALRIDFESGQILRYGLVKNAGHPSLSPRYHSGHGPFEEILRFMLTNDDFISFLHDKQYLPVSPLLTYSSARRHSLAGGISLQRRKLPIR
ncbi:MAG: hypothetical protein CVV45_04110 [Spirochaetae bacterium HGW-Spirochaetae-10]|nr:MAG: hypothetical protein CVV45_04110 [Spirochaetae bacterium HGW-Spirochaetae-10]